MEVWWYGGMVVWMCGQLAYASREHSTSQENTWCFGFVRVELSHSTAPAVAENQTFSMLSLLIMITRSSPPNSQLSTVCRQTKSVARQLWFLHVTTLVTIGGVTITADDATWKKAQATSSQGRGHSGNKITRPTRARAHTHTHMCMHVCARNTQREHKICASSLH